MKLPHRELRHTADPLDRRLFKGGSTSTTGSPTTTNTDYRMALSDAVAVTNGSSVGGDINRITSDWESTSYTDSRTSTNNTNFSDSRANYDSRAYNDHSVTYAADADVLKTLAGTLPDTVNFMVNAGAEVINRAGGAVVDLNRDSMAQNTKAFDSVVSFGAQAVDKLIDASVRNTQAGNSLAAQAVASYQPDAKNQADTAKYALYAAGALVALVLLNGKKA